jgi:hypothetical protein
MSDGEEVELTITGSGLSYTGSISLAQAVDVLALVTSGEGLGGRGGPAGQAGQRSSQRQDAMSPQQALQNSGAKTNSQKIVAFAALVSRQSGKETFTQDDVKPLFRQARLQTPGNLSRDLGSAIQAGWIADAEVSGEYYLVGDAANVLDTGFDGIKARQSGSRSRSSGSRRPKKPVEVPEAFAESEVSPVLPGLIDYHKVKTKTSKYLWAVNAARLLGVEAVDQAELTWLTDRLGEGIRRTDLGGYFRDLHKSGYVNRNNQGKVRITPAGIKRLEELTAENSK